MRSWISRISAVMVLACALACSGLAAAADPLTPAQFLDACVAELQRQAPGAKVRIIDETELRIVAKPGGGEKLQNGAPVTDNYEPASKPKGPPNGNQ